MEKLDESRRYKWSTPATNLLVSIWSHDMVQSRLKLSSRNQPIWESIARYMGRKGFNVTGLQCRTRIKNMLCSYHEAVRKKDQSYIEPYFDLFQKIVNSRNPKKKGPKKSSSKDKRFEEVDGDDGGDAAVLSDASLDIEEPTVTQTVIDQDYSIEYLDVNNQEVQVTTPLTDTETLNGFERIITKAIDMQTKALSQAMKLQSEIVEKLLTSEREKLEAILTAEKESRKQLEERLDRLLARLESNQTVAQIPYMRQLIESRQNEVL